MPEARRGYETKQQADKQTGSDQEVNQCSPVHPRDFRAETLEFI